jgi:hypothetical protein
MAVLYLLGGGVGTMAPQTSPAALLKPETERAPDSIAEPLSASATAGGAASRTDNSNS